MWRMMTPRSTKKLVGKRSRPQTRADLFVASTATIAPSGRAIFARCARSAAGSDCTTMIQMRTRAPSSERIARRSSRLRVQGAHQVAKNSTNRRVARELVAADRPSFQGGELEGGSGVPDQGAGRRLGERKESEEKRMRGGHVGSPMVAEAVHGGNIAARVRLKARRSSIYPRAISLTSSRRGRSSRMASGDENRRNPSLGPVNERARS
jgi:hypothetical protein